MQQVAADPRAVLAAWDLGTVVGLTPAGGTAGGTWRVAASSGEYFLRRRGARTSAEARLGFDHGLRVQLLAHGVPTAAAVSTRHGARWLRAEHGVYEVYPFVRGLAFSPGDPGQIAAAARALARFHQVAAGYRPPGYQPEPVAQYTTLGFSPATSWRMDDPDLQLATVEAVGRLATTPAERGVVARCRARLQRMQAAYAGPSFARLCGWVIHGDYTPANLLFTPAGGVAGIFDLDWSLPGARCRDVADALFFFATHPRQVDPASIWSLTAAAEFDPVRCRLLLDAYQQLAPLAAHELEAVPLAFCGRWISIRLEGMAKVDAADRFRFFARDLELPMDWLEAHWPGLMRA
ncbi:MAG: phosphotransferase [Candidatus Latescibacterota bacterium]